LRFFLSKKRFFSRIKPYFNRRISFLLPVLIVFFSLLLFFDLAKKAGAEFNNEAPQEIDQLLDDNLILIEGNSLLALSDHFSPENKVKKRVLMVITGYSSTVWETDDDPLITASGKIVKKGIVANNSLPFGTKIRIPDLFGEEIFVVEDRMNWTKGNYHIDIWFPSYQEALSFGAKITEVEILGR